MSEKWTHEEVEHLVKFYGEHRQEPEPAELKPCPFCGWEFAEHAWNEFGEEYRVCDQCGASSGTVDSKWDWQSRPIEDALNDRIAELSQAVGLITTLKPTMVMDTEHPLDMAKEVVEYVTVRIAELEMKIRHNALWQASEDAEERAHLEKLVLDLKKRIAELEEQVWNLNLENERLEEAYWIDETISPDGTLKPSVRKLLERLEKAETDLRLSDDLVKALDNRIAELEGKIDQLTAHSDIERQDYKSSNDTQTQTIVYGKEDSEVQE